MKKTALALMLFLLAFNASAASELGNPLPANNSYDVEPHSGSVNLSLQTDSGLSSDMNVSFFNASSGLLIARVNGVPPGGRAEVEWNSVENGSEYRWNASGNYSGGETSTGDFTFETVFNLSTFKMRDANASSEPPGLNSSVVKLDQALNLSVFVYRNVDSYADNVWAVLEHQSGSTTRIGLENTTQINNSQLFSKKVDVDARELSVGDYNVSFYANGTDSSGSKVVQQKVLNESFHVAEGICDRGGYDSRCVVKSEKGLGAGDSFTGSGILDLRDGGALKDSDGATDSIALDFTQVLMRDGSQIRANVNVSTGNFTMRSGAVIDASGLGFKATQGPGTPVYESYYGYPGGAGFGGMGGDGRDGEGGLFYSNASHPMKEGSGFGSGGHSTEDALSGGGRVIVNSSYSRIDGEVIVDGVMPPGDDFNPYSGGSAGSIIVDSSTIEASGLLNAEGVDAERSSGGPSGGRIAFKDASWRGTGLQLDVSGGSADEDEAQPGYPGTIHPIDLCDSGSQASTCYISSRKNVEQHVDIDGELIMLSGAEVLSNNDLDVSAANITVRSGAAVNATEGNLSLRAQNIDIRGEVNAEHQAYLEASSIGIGGDACLEEAFFNSTELNVAGALKGEALNLSKVSGLEVSGSINGTRWVDLTGLLRGDFTFSSSGRLAGRQLINDPGSLDSFTVEDGVLAQYGQRETLNLDLTRFEVNGTLRSNLVVDAQEAVIGSGGVVDASGLGFDISEGPGYVASECGAGFGGEGGYAPDCEPGPTYSTRENPLLEGNGFGSGGGYGFEGQAPLGGGKVVIESDSASIKGLIDVSAPDLTGGDAEGGSGGSILINASTVSGTGLLEAQGANSSGLAGGGGGGRISFPQASWEGTGLDFRLDGGDTGRKDAGPGITGTLYPMNSICTSGTLDSTCLVEKNVRNVTDNVKGSGDLVVAGDGELESNSQLNISMNSVTVREDGELRAVNDLNIDADQNITVRGLAEMRNTSHWNTSEALIEGTVVIPRSREDLYLDASDLKIASQGEIRSNAVVDVVNLSVTDSSGIYALEKGFGENPGPGDGKGHGGAGYGGVGGAGLNYGSLEEGGSSYGAPDPPLVFGGYGSGYKAEVLDNYQSGGGRIIVQSQRADINGTLNVSGVYSSEAGVSGGTVLINSSQLKGNGVISGRGGPGYTGYEEYGGGGGGRIMFPQAYYSETGIKVRVRGGPGYEAGVTGSVWPQSICDQGTPDTTCRVQKAHQAWREVNGTGKLIVESGGLLESNDNLTVDYPEVEVEAGGLLRAKEGSVFLQADKALVAGKVNSLNSTTWENVTELNVSGEFEVGGGDTIRHPGGYKEDQGLLLPDLRQLRVTGLLNATDNVTAPKTELIDVDGTLSSNTSLTITNVSQPGQIDAAGTITASEKIKAPEASSVQVSGVLKSGEAMNLTETGSFHVSGAVSSGGVLDVESTDTVEIESTGETISNGSFKASTTSIFSINGTLESEQGYINAFQASNAYIGETGDATSSGDFNVNEASEIIVEGLVSSGGDFIGSSTDRLNVSGRLEASNRVQTGSVVEANVSGVLESMNAGIDLSSVTRYDFDGGKIEAEDKILLDSLPHLRAENAEIIARESASLTYLDLSELELNDSVLRANLDIDAENVSIDSGSAIDASGLGNVSGPGWNGNDCGSSHGGLGGNGSTCNSPSPTYGDAIYPLQGSTGFGTGNTGSKGGGLIIIDAARFEVNGTVRADGSGTASGGGASGGTVIVKADETSGKGLFSAQGLDGTSSVGGGGGGRISFQEEAWALDYSFDVSGGAGGSNSDPGEAGTVYPVVLEGEWRSESTGEAGYRVYSNATGSWRRIGQFPVNVPVGDVIRRNVKGPENRYTCFRVVSYNIFGESEVNDGNEVCGTWG